MHLCYNNRVPVLQCNTNFRYMCPAATRETENIDKLLS